MMPQKSQFQGIVVVVSSLVFAASLQAADSAAARNTALLHRTDRELAGSNTTSPLGRPVLGYVAQPSPLELRAIFGVPGSAVLSEPLALPKNASRLRLAPGQGYALVEMAAGDPQVLPLGNSEATASTIPGALEKADFAAFSPKGQAVVLYSHSTARLQVITGLPGAPLIAWEVDTSAFVEQPLDAAISDDAATVLLTSSGAVYQLVAGGIPRQLLSVNGAAALAFLPNSPQAAIADRGAGMLYVWQNSGSARQLTGGLTGVGGMVPAADGQGLWLTNPAANTVSWLSLNNAERRTFGVPVSPSKLDKLPYRDMFLIASDPDEPAWFVFQQDGEALSSFVPAVRKKGSALPGEGVRK
jgi:hypothetical protein